MKLKTLPVLAAVTFCIFGTGYDTLAQSTHVTASSLGLGGGGTAYQDSYHANFVNPANLMLNEGVKPRFSMGLFGGISGRAGGSLINIGVYNKYFTRGLTVTGDVAVEALDAWFGTDAGNMRNAGVQLDVVPVGMSYRSDNWAVSMAFRSRVLANTGISRGFAELGIHGLDSEVFATPRPVDFSMKTLAFYEVSFGYSRKILSIPSLLGFARNIKVYAGVAPKLLIGAHASGIDFRSTLHLEGGDEDEIDLIRHDFAYTLETTGEMAEQLKRFYRDRQEQGRVPDIADYVDPSGEDVAPFSPSGLGFDIGGTIEMDLNVPVIGSLFKGAEKLRAGVSLTDIGRISFTGRAAGFSADKVLEWKGFTFDQERIDSEFNGDRGEYMEYVLKDSLATEVYGSFAPDGKQSVERKLPTMVNFGAQLVMNKLSLSVDLHKGFVQEGTSSRRVSLATGLEYRLLDFLPLRVGMRTGGMSSTVYTAGVGLDFKYFELSVAGSAVRDSENYGTAAGAAWSGFVFRF